MTKEKQKKYTLDDLKHFTMPNGLLCFLGDDPNICEIVESMGYDMYYVLADNVTKKTYTSPSYSQWTNGVHVPANSTTITEEEREMALFKVVKNLIGRAVSISEDKFGNEFAGITPVAHYHLPAIPLTLIKKLDEFFRLVDAKHGTESIVLLTFDDKNPDSSDSWGVLVPKQENTSVHCKYDPDSVVELKPFDVSIVGSVHSHPGMAAYASGTDHMDQADFDGIHITFGWQSNVNNGATQYHIEMQMSGVAYTLKPEDVFEQVASVKEPDPEVVKWTENVSKKAFPPYTTTGDFKTNQQTLPKTTQNRTTNTGIKPIDPKYIVDIDQYIRDANLSKTSIVVVELPYDVRFSGPFDMLVCPVCQWDISSVDLANNICAGCNVYIATKSQTASEIVDIVINHEKMVYQTTVDPFTDIYFFCFEKDGKPLLLHIYGNGTMRQKEVERQMGLDYEYPVISRWDDYDDARFSEKSTRNQDISVFEVKYYEDFAIDFHDKFPEFPVYDNTDYNDCSSCTFYYTGYCPAIRDMIDEWLENDKEGLVNFKPITPCPEYVHWSTGEKLVFD
jgi:hypothetical protein